MTYESQWTDLRKRRNILWIIFFAWLPLAGLVAALSRTWLKAPVLAVAAAVVWLVAYAASAWWFASFKCPRCGRRFHVKGWWQNPFANRCLHCGLPKWAAE